MAPRWIKTQDRRPSPFPPKGEDDWLLVSGELVVGRVFRDSSGPHAGRVIWVLTVTPGLVAARGVSDSIEKAQEELLASWRAWQEWAGMRDRD
jgi:hypothetical protein